MRADSLRKHTTATRTSRIRSHYRRREENTKGTARNCDVIFYHKVFLDYATNIFPTIDNESNHILEDLASIVVSLYVPK